MTLDARTAAPEPPLHAATLLSRTRLAQRECAARLGISERTLRYHLTGRPMSYALRITFEALAFERELAHRLVDDFRARFGTDFSKSMGGVAGDSSKCLTVGFDLGTEFYSPRRHFLRDALAAVEGDLPFTGALHNQFLGRVNREGRVTEQTVMHGADIVRCTPDGYEWVDCEPSHPESVVFHFVRTGEKRTMRKVKRDDPA